MGADTTIAESPSIEGMMADTVARISVIEQEFPSARKADIRFSDDPGWSVEFLPEKDTARIDVPKKDLIEHGPDYCESLYLHERLHPEVSGEVLKHFSDEEWDFLGFAFGVNVLAEDNRNEFSGDAFVPGGTQKAGRHLLEDTKPGGPLDFLLDADPSRLSGTVLEDIGYIPAHMRLAAMSRCLFSGVEIGKTLQPRDIPAFLDRVRPVDSRVADAMDRLWPAIGEYYRSIPANGQDTADIARAGRAAASIYRDAMWPEFRKLTGQSVVDHAMVLYADALAHGEMPGRLPDGVAGFGKHAWTPRDFGHREDMETVWNTLDAKTRRRFLDEAAEDIAEAEEAVCNMTRSHADSPGSASRMPDTMHSVAALVENMLQSGSSAETDPLVRYQAVASKPIVNDTVRFLIDQMRIRQSPEWVMRRVPEGEELDMDAFLEKMLGMSGGEDVFLTRELEQPAGALTGMESSETRPGSVGLVVLGDVSKTTRGMRNALLDIAVIGTEYGAKSGSAVAVAAYTADVPGFNTSVLRVLKPFPANVVQGRPYAVSETEKREVGKLGDPEFGGGSSPMSTALYVAADRLIASGKEKGTHTFLIVVTDGMPTDYRKEFLPVAGGREPNSDDIRTAQEATARWMIGEVEDRMQARGFPTTVLCLGVGPGTEGLNRIMPAYPVQLRTAISRIVSARGKYIAPSGISWSFPDAESLVAAFPVITEYALSRPRVFRRR